MSVITISRELGSLGNVVARGVASRLGYRVVWRELINQAALRAGAPEVALAIIDELNLLGISPSEAELQAYIQAVKAVVEELAAEGNVVIVGRAGQIILRGWPDTLHVRLVAPLEVRVERIVQRHQISPQAARAQVEASDRSRRNYLKRFYQINWDNPDLYDLVINTSSVSPESAADLICQTLTHCFPTAIPDAGEIPPD